ncbi:MAG: T9SS type A sorting domain-containing protein [Candidatus Marinimicrobia bacterium]|nr:T9SS type A sorting domain-containing protein [Candidatus Neomarinimicrobiota bacterium]MCF7881834.1 T9SS type A sorting domain-containing protein [Candidatus Neomarinimicrobiota bacterium]
MRSWHRFFCSGLIGIIKRSFVFAVILLIIVPEIFAQEPSWHTFRVLPLEDIEVVQIVPSIHEDSLIYGIGYEINSPVFIKTDDLGAHWTVYPIENLTKVSALDVQYKDNKDIFYATGNSGIVQSTDAGMNWEGIAEDFTDYSFESLAIISDTIYAGTGLNEHNGGILTSYDNGSTWEFHSIVSDTIHAITHLEVSRDHSSIIFGLTDSSRGIIRSRDAGQHWEHIPVSWNAFLRITDVFIPKEGNLHQREVDDQLFVVVESGELYGSNDWGETWHLVQKPHSFDPLDVGSVPSQTIQMLQHPNYPWLIYIITEQDGLWGSLNVDRFSPQPPSWRNIPFRSCALTASGDHLFFGGENGAAIFQMEVNPPHTNWERFYPMHIGDFWVYTVDDLGNQWEVKQRVVSDTVLHGVKWQVLQYEGASGQTFARIDSAGNILRKNFVGDDPYRWLELDVAWGDTMSYEPYISDGYFWEVTGVDTIQILPSRNPNDIRITYYQDYLTYTRLQLQENLGVVYERWEGGVYRQLKGAYIHGTVYGDTLFRVNIAESDIEIPERIQLSPPFPNPFNAATTIPFATPEPGNVDIRLFDLRGQFVDEIMWRGITAGNYRVPYNNPKLASGMYLLRLVFTPEADPSTMQILSRKMVVVK